MENLEVNTHETNVIDMCIKLAEMEKLTAMKIYMAVKGISTKGLADHFGLTSGAVNLWLLGKSIPHIRTHNKVAVSPKKELAGSKWKMGYRMLTKEKCEELLDKCFALFLTILMIVFSIVNGIICICVTPNTIDNAWGYLFSLLVLNVCTMAFCRMKCKSNNLEQK